MRRFIERVKEKEPHERRTHALRIASGVMAVVAVGWLGSLGYRLSSGESATAREEAAQQTASVIMGFIPPYEGLQVASTSYSGN